MWIPNKSDFGFRWLAKVMVWMSLFLSIALLIVGCVYCGFKYSEIKEEGTDNDGVDDLIDIGFTTDVDEYLSLSSLYISIINKNIEVDI